MVIEIIAPDDWSPGQTLAVQQLFQHVVRGAQPVICSVREDITPEQLEDIYHRINALIRESGLEIPAQVA